jgi:hypothetical protein
VKLRLPLSGIGPIRFTSRSTLNQQLPSQPGSTVWRIHLAALALLMLIASTGCGGGGGGATSDQQGTTSSPPPVELAHTTVSTYHNTNDRTGSNLTETVLTPDNVNAVSFGKRAAVPVAGSIFAQPLYIPGVSTSTGSHNLVIVATEHDQVYAVDADSRTVVWHTDFLGTSGSVTTVASTDVNCGAIAPEIGITGTPVIDTTSATIYVVVRTKETQSGATVFYQRLHALDLSTGQDKVPPTTITTPPDPAGQFGVAQFDPLLNHQRAALLLSGGQVYVAWASHCDLGNYQGWLIAFDAISLQETAGWTPDPSGSMGGIWMSGAGPTADSNGDVYLAVGNGWSDAMTGGSNYGDAVVHLHNSSNQISTVDYFIPFDWQTLYSEDHDLGSGGPVHLPEQSGSTHPHLLTVAGKDGKVYLLDRDNLGQSQPDNDDQIVQSFQSDAQYSLCTPAFWNNTLYFGWTYGPVEAFRYNPSTQQIGATPFSTTGSFDVGYPGATPSISANGSVSGILWFVRNDGAYSDLRAYDALDLTRELYSSQMSPGRDQSGPSIVFGVPTIADGWVFIGAQGELDIYGLLAR